MSDLALSRNHRYQLLVIVCLACIMVPLLFTGPALSIPALAQDLGKDQATLSWIVNAFGVAFSSCVLAAGALSDQYGRKKCALFGLLLFILTSLAMSMASDIGFLIFCRAVQGIGGAFLITAASALLAQEFEGYERIKAFSFLGTSFGVGLAFGPMLAGYMITHFGWRSLYLVMAILAGAIFYPGLRIMRDSKDINAKGIDWTGLCLFVATLIAFTVGLVKGPMQGWASLSVMTLLISAGVLFCLFVYIELHKNNPMLDLSLFKFPRFVGVQILPLATGFSFVVFLVYLPIWFITIQGRDPLTAGLAILPLTAPTLIVPLIAGRLTQYFSAGTLSGIGFILVALGEIGLLRMTPHDSLWAMSLPMLMIGVGNGLPWGLMDGLSVGVLPKERAGMASGIFTTMRVTGESVAITAMGAALMSLSMTYLGTLSQNTQITLPQSAIVLMNNMNEVMTGQVPMAANIISLMAQAYTQAMHHVLVVLVILTLLAAVVCFSMLRKPVRES